MSCKIDIITMMGMRSERVAYGGGHMVVLSWVNNLSSNLGEIVSALIQAAGAITAAVIAAYYANRIAKGFKFHTYAEAPQDICTIMRKARSDIFIITAVGDNLLEVTEKTLEKKLRAGVYVRYMMLDVDRFHEMEKYMHGPDAKDGEIRDKALEILTRLKEKYPDSLEVRFSSQYMTASCIGIDTCPDPSREKALLTPFIQAVIYQYHVSVKDSFVMYFHERTERDRKYYEATAKSMRDMWEDASMRPRGRALPR